MSTSGRHGMQRQPLRLLREAGQPLVAEVRHDAAQLDRLRDAAFAILERTGARYQSPRALDILAEHGARVDRAEGVARLSSELVQAALATVPRVFTLGSRDGSCDLAVGSGATYCGPDGCGTEVVDWHSGERRASTKADLAAITRMLDYLGSMQFWWPAVGAGDCGATAELHELDAGWNNTVKHLQGMVNGERAARYAVEMARVVAGGAEALRRRPVMSDLTTVVTPLLNDRDGTEASLVFAEAGVPMCFAATPCLGTTAPATKAGAYALAVADLLSAIVPVQLAYPGAPVIASLTQIYADPQTAAVMTAPLDHRALTLGTALLHHVGLPALSSFGGTDGELPGTWQTGVETLQSLLLAPLDGCELMTGVGLTDTYKLFTPENLILDDDLYHRVRHAFLDIVVDDETLALDVIDAVGPGGHFLAQAHTRRHMPDAVLRAVTQQIDPGNRHYRDLVEVARERAHDILESYEPEPLDEDKQREIAVILQAADRELRR